MIDESMRPVHPYFDALLDLRAEGLRWIAGGAIALACAVVYVWAFDSRLTRPDNLIVAALLAVPAGIAWRLADRSYAVAVALLAAGTAGGVVTAAIRWSSGEILYALPLVLFMAPVLTEFREALALAAADLGLILGLAVFHLAPLPTAGLSTILLLTLAAAGLAWVGFQPTRAMVTWTWVSYLQERQKTEEVRQRQAELARLSKGLEEACERLEQANLALAQARRAAEEARRHKEEFATAISHELRTPINLIIGFSEMVMSDAALAGAAGARQDVETIYRNACHLSALVDDVLDLGRLDAQRLGLVKRPTSVSAMVEEAVQTVRGLYASAGLRLLTELPTDLPDLEADVTRVRQVLINLLTNAVRYLEPGGEVRIAAARADGYVRVSVADNGAGIGPEDLPYVFERFQQTGHPGRRGGFGLGLTVSKQLIELHGGAMTVASEVDRGTIFTFTLPIGSNVVARAGRPRLDLLEPRRGDRSSDQTVLVVSSDEEAGRVFERYLDGYHVRRIASSDELSQLDRQPAVRAIILANQISDDLVRSIRDRFRRVPTVRCLLHTTDRAGQQLGVAAFLSKPVTSATVLQALHRLRLHPRRVLVVDDDPDMARLIGRMIRSRHHHCRVHLAAGATEGLEIARQFAGFRRIDAVFLDLLMPEVDGHAFIQTWNADATLRSVPIVVISAASEEDHDRMVAESLEICREGGLPVSELLALVQGSLDRLAAPADDGYPS